MTLDKIDERFESLLTVVKNNGLPVDFIKKAYAKAKDLHKDQKRKDGTPYIYHPVEVAMILAKLDFDENVIAGGLLHDTIEDCGYTKEQMVADFNNQVFKLVDCVSEIDKNKYAYDKENIYEDTNFVKSSAEEQTFKKLIYLGKENPCGFAIKFADRLHNLRTIGTFDHAKQLEKVRETEKWILPIAKALQSEYFYRAIKNECFKIVNQNVGKLFFEHYKIYHTSNHKNVENLEYKFKEIFASSSIKTIKIKNVREYKVFEDLTRLYKKVDISKISQGQILKVANYNIFLLYSMTTHKTAMSELIYILQNETNLKIIDIKIGGFTGKSYMVVEDEFKNKYNVYLLTENEYTLLKVGTISGQNLDKLDEDNLNELDVDIIRVKTRSNEVKYMPKGSTALDFAFKIHRDIGFAFKYACINDSRSQLPPYTKLNDGDKVEIIVDKDETGKLKINAQLKWLAYVNTELAKKVLIKYFESRM